ncbi:MAG: M16 family metallopeptidase [Bacteroidales bacterium]
MKKNILLFLICASAIGLFAQKKQYPEVDIIFKKYVLDNGLTLIVSEDHKAPIASFNIWYHVGSKNEKPGKTGFAHLFEHIMFTSTEHWKNFDDVMQTVGGGSNNGTTNNDRTNYYETFSNGGLDRVLWLEADRMGFLLNGLDSVKVNVQRGVVQNEKRTRENQPYGITEELMAKGMYPVGHPYSWTVIGSMDDLNAASIDDVKAWFKTYYGPNNAVICISGDVKSDEVFNKVKKYFGDIPAGPPIAKYGAWTAKMTGTKYQVAQDRVPQARLHKTWNVPEWNTKDIVYLNILGEILSSGKSSRLYKRLVLDEQLTTNAYAYLWSNEIGGNFFIQADAKPGVELAKIDAVIQEELQKIFTEEVTAVELERVKTNYFANFINSMESINSKSDLLAENETFGGSPDYYKTKQTWMKEATAADIKKVAIQWLSDGEYQLQILPYGDFTNTNSGLNRNEMPAVETTGAVTFPQIKQFTLSNGLKVYLAERHGIPSVSASLMVNAGYAADQFGSPGLAKLSGTMFMEGTRTKTATQISDLLYDLGSDINTNSRLDNSFLNLKTLKLYFDTSFSLFADILLNPSFPQKEFERVQKEQMLGIEQEKANPGALGRRVLPGLIYGSGHAYSNPLSGMGTEAGVNKITREDLVKFHQTWFVPNNASLVVAGDITEAELKPALEKYFAGWKAQEVPKMNLSDVAMPAHPAVYIIDKPGVEQSSIYAAELSPSACNPDQDAIELMNAMLGGTFLSRLNMNLREDKHWCYGARSQFVNATGQSIFYASAAVQTDKTKESIIEFQKELAQVISTKPIGETEFKNEQLSQLLSLAGRWETNDAVKDFLLNTISYNRGLDYPGKYSSRLQNFTPGDMKKAAAKVVKPDNLTWLIIGDRAKIEKGIKELNIGPVKFLDADGKEIK